MPELIPDTRRVRAFLRQRCPGDLVDRLELTYVNVKRDGSGSRFLYESADARHPGLRVSARQVLPLVDHEVSAKTTPNLYSPDLQLLFEVFPADRRLDSLGTLTDASAMARHLQAALPRDPLGTAVREVAVRVVRYKPERKCVLRYAVEWTSDTGRPRVVYAKALRAAELGRTSRVVTWLRRSAGRLDFDLPEPLGVLPGLGAGLFSEVLGEPLSKLGDAEGLPGVCRRAGEALRDFHGRRTPALPRQDVPARIAQLARTAEGLRLLLVPDDERVERLSHRLARRLQEDRPRPSCLIHGDFHGDNVLVHGSRLGLIDLDDSALGDPAADLGCLWAQLRWLAIKGTGQPSLLARGQHAFLDGYVGAGPSEAATGTPLYAALHCFLFAYQCVRHGPTATRCEQARALLTTCEDVLTTGLA